MFLQQRKQISEKGFTLIELVISIVVTAIIAGVAYPIILYSTRSYNQQVYRKEVSTRARLALERIAREIRSSVPNSIRVSTNLNANDTIEFGNSVFLSYYSSINNAASPYDLMDDSAITVIPAASFIVIYNTSVNEYYRFSSATSTTTFSINSINSATGVINFSAPTAKPSSPYNRFTLSDTPVCYSLETGGELIRYSGYSPSTTQNHTSDATHQNLLIDNVESLKFDYVPGALSNAGLVMISLRVTIGSASMDFHQEVHIRNVP